MIASVQPASTSPTIQLRDFQTEMVRQTYAHISAGINRILAIATCGAGKTFYACWMIRDAVKRGRRVVFLVDLDCLVKQTQKSLLNLGVVSTTYKAGAKFDPNCSVIVASCQTLDRRLNKSPLAAQLGLGFHSSKKLIIADEAHDTYGRRCVWQMQEDYPADIHIGLTATPWRTKRDQYLGQLYDETVIAPQAPELIARGLSVPARGYCTGGVLNAAELDKSSTGDYDIRQQERIAIQRLALDTVVNEWVRLGENKPTPAYCPSVAVAKALAERFNACGIPADFQHGETDTDERDRHTEALDKRQLKVLTSVGTLTKGWDLKSVGTVIFYRETTSKSLFFQATGRGARILDYQHPAFPFGKQWFNVLDFGTNLKRFGSVSDTHDFYIGPPRKGGDGQAVMKECPECGCGNYGFALKCTNCGYEFPIAEKEEKQITEVELLEWFSTHDRKKVAFLRDALRACYQNQISPQNAINEFNRLYGFVPPPAWFRGAVLGMQPDQDAQRTYVAYLRSVCKTEIAYRTFAHYEFGGGN